MLGRRPEVAAAVQERVESGHIVAGGGDEGASTEPMYP